jgi:hypothetical protein
VLIAFFAQQVCGFFGLRNAEEISLGIIAIRIFCFSTFFGGINTVLCEFCMARDMTFPAFLSSTLRGAVILIPAALIFSRFGPRYFWLLYPVTEILSLTIFLLYLRFGYHAKNTIPSERIYYGLLRAKTAHIDDILSEIEAFCKHWYGGDRQCYLVRLTVKELCTTILVKGFGPECNPDGLIRITLAAAEDGTFILNIRDNAAAFDPFALKQSNLTEVGTSEIDPAVFGVETVMKYSRKFFYRRYEGFNTLMITI